jgi:cytochrome c peroxidase
MKSRSGLFMKSRSGLFQLCLLILITGPITGYAEDYQWQLPPGFPEPLVSDDNPMSTAKVSLGRWLFYDPRLSSTGAVSCATCHQQSRAFTDGLKTPTGELGERLEHNAMSLVNLAYRLSYGWTNPATRHLEQQMLRPLFTQSPVEMGASSAEQDILARLNIDVSYRLAFQQAFTDPDPVTWNNIIKAIASFERTLISGRSIYDEWVFSDVRPPPAIVRGMNLFFSARLACGGCHGGIGFNNEFHFLTNSDQTKGRLKAQLRFTGLGPVHLLFRVPSLRNIALTAPYMHDGRFEDLESVISHYASGPAPEHGLTGFDLSAVEQQELIQFLNSLTDETFLSNKRLSDPYR